MTEQTILDFHAHIYFDADQIDRAHRLAKAAHERFGVPVGHFHRNPVGPHPRGSCQLTIRPEQFGEFAKWIALHRAGLTIFAVLPGLKTGDWRTALMWGALFGLFAYGTYDLTNYATLKSWGLKITLMDMTWGVVVSGVSSAAACAAALRLMKMLNLTIPAA